MATKKRRSAKQRANDKRLGQLSKQRTSRTGKRTIVKRGKAPTKQRKSAKVKSKSKPRKDNNMAGKKKGSSSRKGGIKGIFSNPTLKKVMFGVGAATVTGVAVNAVAPQFAPIARPVAAFLAGGPVGLIADLVLSGGGGFGNILSNFGLGGGGQDQGLRL